MPKITIVKADWGKAILAAYKPKFFTLGNYSILAEIDVDKKTFDQFGGTKGVNDDMDTKVSEAGREVYQAFLAQCVDHLKWADGIITKAEAAFKKDNDVGAYSVARTNAERGLQAMIEKEVKPLAKDIEVAALKRLDKWKKTKSDYRSYKAKIAAKVAFAVTTLTVRAANVAAMPVNPLAVIMGIRGTLRDVVTIVLTLSKAVDDVDTFQNRISGQLDTLLKACKSSSKVGKGLDVAAAFMKFWTSSDGETSFDSLLANIKQYRGKLLKVELEAQKAGKKLTQTLNALDDLNKVAPSDLKSESEKLEKTVDGLIKELIEINAKVKAGNKWADSTETQAKAAKKAKGFEGLGKIVKYMDTAADILGGVLSWTKLAANSAKAASTIATQTATLGKALQRFEGDIKALGKK